MDVPAIQAALLDWYDVHRRVLPFRVADGDAADPYRVWVSEVMLQQTRADVVAKRFDDWLRQFPTIGALAAAPESEVLAAWSGLGYYGRARRLHAAAQVVARSHNGQLPAYAEDLRCLPGIGDYIAGAVASIAFGQAVPAVDGNVIRILSRLLDMDAPVDRAAGRRTIDALARDLVAASRPGDWNQALMDLGSTVCTPAGPDCPACPLASHCAALAAGTVDARPVTVAKRSQRLERLHFAVLRQGHRVLMCRRAEGLLAGTWLPPGGSVDEPLEDLVRRQTGLYVRIDEAAGQVRHVFSHRIWDATVHGAEVLDGDLEGAAWVDPEQIGISTAARKLLTQVQRAVPQQADQ